MNKKIKNKIKKLNKKIEKYSFYYNNLNKSLIKDEEYDFLIKKLEKMEKNYPKYINKNNITNKIKYYLPIKNKNNKHYLPMLSINNIYNKKELKKYINNIKKKFKNIKINFCCELKIDGVAISLIYINNFFKYALTRGDGIYGENVTENIKQIKNIPLYIKENINKYLEIRGEIFITKKNFYKINKKQNKKKEKIFSNQRNLTSGTIRLIDKNIVKKRNLSFIGYDLIINKKNRLHTNDQFKCLNKIKKYNFKIEKNSKICSSYKEIINFYNKILLKRKKLKYEIDGIVIKINNREIQETISNNNKYIKWAIAFKFPTKKKITILKKIKYKISKQGFIIPIGIIKPTFINGTIIKKINLHNLKYLSKLSLRKNNKIIIEKSGEIIPKINKIIKCEKNEKIKIPKKCPSCKNKLNFKNNIPKCNLYYTCKNQIKKRIYDSISKNGLNIKNIGQKLINKLIDKKYIKNNIDILNIKKKQLLKINKIKKKKANNILKSIKHSKKNIKLHKFIYSLSIPNIGKTTSKNISKEFKTLKNFIFFKIKNIKNISKKKIYYINKYLKNKNNIKYINSLYNIYKNKIN